MEIQVILEYKKNLCPEAKWADQPSNLRLGCLWLASDYPPHKIFLCSIHVFFYFCRTCYIQLLLACFIMFLLVSPVFPETAASTVPQNKYDTLLEL